MEHERGAFKVNRQMKLDAVKECWVSVDFVGPQVAMQSKHCRKFRQLSPFA
jgi:hypothetical protein